MKSSQIGIHKQNQRQVVAIGDYLYLVQGIIRWGLYDLLKGTLTLVDEKSGELLNQLHHLKGISPIQKHNTLEEYAKPIWKSIEKLDITNRLFKPDTSPKSANTALDLLWLEITNACNERCIHCYTRSKPTCKNIMSLNFAKSIIYQGYEEGFHKIQFTGGEPFTHSNIWEMVHYAYKLGYPEIEIYTNLTLLKETDFRNIKSLRIEIATSLLGPNARIHDACTKTPGSFQRWYKNIKKIKKTGIKYRIGVIRMKQNENLMEDIEKFLRTKNLLTNNEPFEPDDVRLSGRGSNKNVQPSKVLDYNLHLIVKPSFFHNARRYNPCWRGEIAITASGSAHPCIFSRELTVGNLKKERMKDIIERLEKTYWRITLDQVEKCHDCELRYACMDCRALSLNPGKGLYGSPVRCNYDPYH